MLGCLNTRRCSSNARGCFAFPLSVARLVLERLAAIHHGTLEPEPISSQERRQPSLPVPASHSPTELASALSDVTISSPISPTSPTAPRSAGLSDVPNGPTARRRKSLGEPQQAAAPPTSGLLALAHWISRKDEDNKEAEVQSARSNAIKLVEVVLSGVEEEQARESAKKVLAEPLKHVNGNAAKRALELLDSNALGLG
jgi:hypothetical protein